MRRQQRRTARGWPDTGLFFCTPTGNPWHPDTVSKRFDHLVTTSGQPPYAYTTYATAPPPTYARAGADLRPSKKPRTRRPQITADTYTSILTELKRATAEAAANLVPRQRRTG